MYPAAGTTVSERSSRQSVRKRPRRPKAGSASGLARFLEHPSRPPETLRYHELQGFLFVIASAPETVLPSEWLPEVFGGHEAEFESVEESETILFELTTHYNAINASVASERAMLPDDCPFRRDTLANLDEGAPVSQWARGFKRGYQWLEKDWDPYVPEEFTYDFGALLMILTFFASEDLAMAYVKEVGKTDLEDMADKMRETFPDALAEYARIGRAIHRVVLEHGAAGDAEASAAAPEPPPRPRVGRNEPCPCGSGRKYKKCCGAGAPH